MSETTYQQRYATADTNTTGAFAFDTVSAKDYAVSKLAFGAVGSVTYVDASNPLPVTISGVATAANQATGNASLATIAGAVSGAEMQVDIVSAPTLTIQDGGSSITVDGSVSISGSVAITAASLPLPSGAATAANQSTGNASLASIDGKLPALGQALAAASVPVVLTAAQLATLAPLSAVEVSSSALPTGAATSAKQDTGNTSLASIDGKIPALGQALAAASVPVVLTAAQLTTLTPLSTVAATQSGSWSVSIGATLPAGTNAIGKLAANAGVTIGAVEIASAQTLATVTTVSTVTNLSQMGGAAIAMGTGARSSGTQRVTIATDDVVPASQSGTWTVQPGNTANSTAWLVSDRPATSGGLTPHKTISAASTNATVVKASAGQLYDIEVYNLNASPRYLKLYNKATSPSVGSDTPVRTILIPGNTAGGGVVRSIPLGLAFSTGIAFALTTGIADSDTGAVAANEIAVNLGYA